MAKTILLAAGLALVIGGVAVAQTARERIYVPVNDVSGTKKAMATIQADMNKPVYVASKDIDALVAKTKDGIASAQMPTSNPNHITMIAHREADGEVEVHTKLADEIIVRTGHARIKVGGKVSAQRQTAPNEFRGGTITGGQVFDLKPGDAIYVPVGVPHQMLIKKGEQITYTAAKFPG
jgi:mannose-6-phosphate isomerase-like protein (cupin superfamily)